MVTALLLAVAGGAFYFAAVLSSTLGEAQISRTAALSAAKAKLSSGQPLSEKEAELLLEDEILEHRNNRFRNL